MPLPLTTTEQNSTIVCKHIDSLYSPVFEPLSSEAIMIYQVSYSSSQLWVKNYRVPGEKKKTLKGTKRSPFGLWFLWLDSCPTHQAASRVARRDLSFGLSVVFFSSYVIYEGRPHLFAAYYLYVLDTGKSMVITYFPRTGCKILTSAETHCFPLKKTSMGCEYFKYFR